MMEPQQGMKLGRYLLEAPIGKGGQGRVFRGRQINAAGGGGKPVVIKMARESVMLDSAERELFLDEARRAFYLGGGHPNIVAVTDVDVHDGVPFIVMEFVDGVDLRHVLLHYRKIRKTPVPLPLASSILGDMAMGLHYAHLGREIDGVPLALVHRDVKPANTLITYGGQAKLIDFGISTTAVDERTGKVSYGTPRYMSPEHVYCRVDPKMDVYSLAIVAWELLENRPYRPSCKNHPWAILNDETPRLENPKIPADLVELVESSLSMSPASRPSAYEFGTLLSRHGQGRRVVEQVGAMVRSVLGRGESSAFTGYMEIPEALRDGPDGNEIDEIDDDETVAREPKRLATLAVEPREGVEEDAPQLYRRPRPASPPTMEATVVLPPASAETSATDRVAPPGRLDAQRAETRVFVRDEPPEHHGSWSRRAMVLFFGGMFVTIVGALVAAYWILGGVA